MTKKNYAYFDKRVKTFEKILCEMTSGNWNNSWTPYMIKLMETHIPLVVEADVVWRKRKMHDLKED